MPYTVTCQICKDTKAIEEYGGRILLWDFRSFDAMYAGKLCNDCISKLISMLNKQVRNPEYDKQFLDYFGVKL